MEINEKIVFKIIYSLDPFYRHEENYLNFRRILKGKIKPKDNVENLFEYCCHLFKTISVNDKIDNKIFEYRGLKYKDNIFDLLKEKYDALTIFKEIIKQRIFNDYSKEMASIIYNATLLKKEQLSIIMTNQLLEQLMSFIDRGIDDSSLQDIIYDCKKKSIFFNQKYDEIKLEDIKRIIISKKTVLLEKYNINKIWIYGSFARGEETVYSDVDIMIEKEEDYDLKPLRSYLSNLLKRVVDIKNHSLNNEFFAKDPLLERILIFDIS